MRSLQSSQLRVLFVGKLSKLLLMPKLKRKQRLLPKHKLKPKPQPSQFKKMLHKLKMEMKNKKHQRRRY